MGKKYIKFNTGFQPKNKILATELSIQKLRKKGYKIDEDFSIVSIDMLPEPTFKKFGGSIKTYSKGGGVRKPKMTAGY